MRKTGQNESCSFTKALINTFSWCVFTRNGTFQTYVSNLIKSRHRFRFSDRIGDLVTYGERVQPQRVLQEFLEGRSPTGGPFRTVTLGWTIFFTLGHDHFRLGKKRSGSSRQSLRATSTEGAVEAFEGRSERHHQPRTNTVSIATPHATPSISLLLGEFW
jgi:hypothetical protein